MAAEREQRRVVAALRKVLDRREQERAPVRLQRVLGRNEDGTTRQQRLDAECVTRSAPNNTYGGQITAEPAGSAFSRRGTAGAALVQQVGSSRDVLWLERLVPDTYSPGELVTVQAIGRGFQPTTRIDFLLPGGPRLINEDITILDIRYIDPQTLELDIQVAPAARLLRERAPVAYGDPR